MPPNTQIFWCTLSPIIPPKWKEANIGGTHLPLLWVWEEGYLEGPTHGPQVTLLGPQMNLVILNIAPQLCDPTVAEPNFLNRWKSTRRFTGPWNSDSTWELMFERCWKTICLVVLNIIYGCCFFGASLLLWYRCYVSFVWRVYSDLSVLRSQCASWKEPWSKWKGFGAVWQP